MAGKLDRRTLDRRTLVAGGGLLALAGCGSPVGTVLPEVVLPPLPGLMTNNGWPVPGFTAGEFRRRVAVLNVWASWCPYCQGEHDDLLRLSQDRRFRLLGLVYRDKAGSAANFLRQAGNPFEAVAMDDGRLSRALGQGGGVPATYVIDRNSRVITKIAGAIDDGSISSRLMPSVLAAMDGKAVPLG